MQPRPSIRWSREKRGSQMIECDDCGGSGEWAVCGGSGLKSCGYCNSGECPECGAADGCQECGGEAEVECDECGGTGACPECEGEGEATDD